MRKSFILAAAALFWAASALFAQDGNGLTEEVFYLLPEMGYGTVYFSGKAPANGELNICAVDNTVRYMDHGSELAVEIDDSMTRVVIDGNIFIPYEGVFLRLYPFGDDCGVAVRRNVTVMNDGKAASYGMESNTTAVTSIIGFSDTGLGQVFTLEEGRDIPYRMSHVVYAYRDGNIMTLNKRNLQRAFPEAKDKIEAYFSEHKKLENNDPEKVLALVREWMGN
jgi:hypothetical protein